MTVEEIVKQALIEDIGDGDHTTLSTIPATATGKARLLVKEAGVISGIGVAREVFRQVDPALRMNAFMNDGDRIQPGDIAFEVTGPSASILMAERLALNFLQRMSGIATNTARYAAALEGLSTRVLDTRKTTPLLRRFEKEAVVHGGGMNHRMGLYDMMMIKDNHVDFAGGIEKAIDRARNYQREKGIDIPIEIEVRNLEELQQVLDHGGVQRIMLDNFPVEMLKEAVARIGGKYETEASGGINLNTIRSFAETGVDFVSVGALTHQINSLDLSLKAVK